MNGRKNVGGTVTMCARATTASLTSYLWHMLLTSIPTSMGWAWSLKETGGERGRDYRHALLPRDRIPSQCPAKLPAIIAADSRADKEAGHFVEFNPLRGATECHAH